LPFNDEYFDIVIANQVLEHTKDIWWITSEISRVIKKGGIFLVGVPNLLSLHNQLLMLLGRHPISIEIVGPHVRGFTIDGFSRFIKLDNYFELLKVAGSNFYPFPINISKIACKLFPMWSVGIFFLVQRTSRVGNFIHTLDSRLYETAYFRGK
jgi:SAM-dependent methyltransferase